MWRVFGPWIPGGDYQDEAAERPRPAYESSGDQILRFARALRLPRIEVGGMTFTKRLTLILLDGAIEKVFYPVFPPDRNAPEVVSWLRAPA